MQPILIFSVILSMASLCWAMEQDSRTPLRINANSYTLHNKEGITIYEGHVLVKQGTTTLLADQLVTQNNTHHQIEKAIAYGTTRLAEYSTIPKAGDPVLHAKAKIIKLLLSESTVILEGNVMITQGNNSFHGPVIMYNMKTQVVTVPPSKAGNATILIDPKQISLSQ